jgi:hypothetical protein
MIKKLNANSGHWRERQILDSCCQGFKRERYLTATVKVSKRRERERDEMYQAKYPQDWLVPDWF